MPRFVPGDELMVVRLDRLGRSTRSALDIAHERDLKGAALTVLKPHVSIKEDTGRIVLTVLGMVAEAERGFIRARQRDGIARAKEAGVYTGGKRRIDTEKVISLRQEGEGPTEIAKALGVSRMQVHRILKTVSTESGKAA